MELTALDRRSFETPDLRGDDHARSPDEAFEREQALRTLLLDSRDALVRSQLGIDSEDRRGADGSGAAGMPGKAPAGYGGLRRRLRTTLDEVAPPGSLILIVSRGDDRLLEVGNDRRAWHFPSRGDGGYAGHHPADSDAAIAQLERLRSKGAGFLVFPATGLWWLDHYELLARHLDRHYRRVVDDPRTGVVYDVRERIAGATSRSVEVARRGELAIEPGSPRPLAAVTIISRNYLPQARVLASSFLRHEPESRFYLLVVDRLPADVEVGADVVLIDPEELEIPDFYEMCFKYGIVEFNTAVKPYLLSLLLQQYGEEEVVYFDPDIVIMRRLVELRDALDRGDIVLTPHIMQPLPLDGKRPSEQDIMISGAYNLGFIALRRTAETEAFLEWWEDRLRDGCRIDVSNGLFTDQKWIDLVPSLFPSTYVLRDPTYNVAFWNLHERAISRDGEGFLVNGAPAGFFHISGFNPEEPGKLSKHQNRTEVVPGSALEAMLQLYAERLRESGYEEASRWEYGYERFDNGIRVHPLLRQIYLKLSPEERRRFGDPFTTGEPTSFLDWAITPSAHHGGLSPFLQTIYDMRYDLPLTFPDVRGRDRKAFLKWARRWGSAEMGFEPALVRDEEVRAGGNGTASEGGTGAGGKAEGHSTGGSLTTWSSSESVVERVRNVARAALPAGSTVLVISRGDYRLLDLGGSEGWHFPQTDDGVYGGYHPPDSEVAIAHLEALRQKGAGYLLVPQTALWWLEYYEGLRRHLETNYRPVVEDLDSCLIYSLRGSLNGSARSARAPRAERTWSSRRWWQWWKPRAWLRRDSVAQGGRP